MEHILAIIVQVCTSVAAVTAALTAIRSVIISKDNKSRIQEIHVMVNNRLTQFMQKSEELLRAKQRESYAAGHAAGASQAKDRFDGQSVITAQR